MKNLEIDKTKPTFIISILKVEYWVVLVSSISNFFTNKNSLANKWMSFSSSNLALFCKTFFYNIKLKDTSIFSLFRWFGTGQKKYWACSSEKCCLFQKNLLSNFIESYFENGLVQTWERPLMTSDFRVGRGVQNDSKNRTF